MSLDWPSGSSVRGSYGAASTVPTIPGSISYAEFSYVTGHHLTTVELQNKAGQFVAPTAETFAAAAENATWTAASHFAVDLTDMSGERSWPLVSATFVLVPRSPSKSIVSAATLKLFAWAFGHGDEATRSLQYVSLPSDVKAEVEHGWGE